MARWQKKAPSPRGVQKSQKSPGIIGLKDFANRWSR